MVDSDENEGSLNAADEAVRSPFDKFDDASNIADTFLFYRQWPAWSVWPRDKTVAPSSNVFIGNADGDVVFKRTVLLTWMLDLMNELAESVHGDLLRLVDLPGYKFDLPRNKRFVLGRMNDTIASIQASLELLEKNDLLVSSVEPEGDQTR